MRNKFTINESQLTRLVMEGVRRALREMGYENGVGADVVPSDNNGDEPKGKNWFANNGIITLNSTSPKAWVTTTFLGNRRLAGKLGANWTTASQKPFFNSYTVDSDAILVVCQDSDSGEIYQIQYNADGPMMAASSNGSQVDPNGANFSIVNRKVKANFDKLLGKTKQMCQQEDEFFNSKTSKTYDNYRTGGKNARYNGMAMRNNLMGKNPSDSKF